MFLDLVDRSGRMQLLVQHDRLQGREIALGDLIGIVGRPTKTKRGERAWSSISWSYWRRTSDRFRTHFTGLLTPRFATGSVTSTC